MSALKDRSIFIAFYREGPSVEAQEKFKVVKERATASSGGNSNISNSLDYYESWPDLPESGDLIDVFVGPRYSLIVGSVFTRFPSMDTVFTYKDRSQGSLQIVVQQKSILGNIFDSRTRDQLGKFLRPKIKALMSSTVKSGETAVCIPLYDVLTE